MNKNLEANEVDYYLPINIQKGNLWRLTIAQAFAGANAVVIFATGAIIGNQLAPTPILATLPITIFVIGMTVCILPLGVVAKRYGRRTSFLIGTAGGVLAGIFGGYTDLMVDGPPSPHQPDTTLRWLIDRPRS